MGPTHVFKLLDSYLGKKATRYSVGSVAAAGSSQATAAALPNKRFVAVTAADDAKGVVLPVALAGKEVVIQNTVANKVLPVYPASGDQIASRSAADLAHYIGYSGITRFVCKDGTTWYPEDVVPGWQAITASATETQAAGSAAGVAIYPGISLVSVTGGATDAFALPKSAAIGTAIRIINRAAVALKLFPHDDDTTPTINGGVADAEVQIAANAATSALKVSATDWSVGLN